jgi:hypothetical protein
MLDYALWRYSVKKLGLMLDFNSEGSPIVSFPENNPPFSLPLDDFLDQLRETEALGLRTAEASDVLKLRLLTRTAKRKAA